MLRVRVSDRLNVLGASRAQVTRLLRLAAPPGWEGAELSLAVVSGNEMAALNKRYTGRRGETDVLAFSLQGDPSPAAPTVGEIVVNASLAAREAAGRGGSAVHELALYALHGALHLAGYDDHDAGSRREMYSREEELLRRAGLPSMRDRPTQRGAPNGARR